jgi:ketosteroid isomerase-like protein
MARTIGVAMTRTAQRAALLAGTPDDVETAFYEALQAGDVERLMACWADEDEIVCVHPGSARLLGAAAIRAAFMAMLEQGGLNVRPAQVVRVQALASAVHSVVEHVRVMLPDGPREALVAATNVYHKTPQGWRLVAHHASTGGLREADAAAPPQHVRH